MNFKLAALNATVQLERARLDSGEDSATTGDLLEDMQAIYTWLVKED